MPISEDSGNSGGFLAQWTRHQLELRQLHEEEIRRIDSMVRRTRQRAPRVTGDGSHGSGHGGKRIRISDEVVDKIRRTTDSISAKDLAGQLGLHPSTVERIRNFQTHRDRKPKRSHLSPAGKQAISDAQRKRWAKTRTAA